MKLLILIIIGNNTTNNYCFLRLMAEVSYNIVMNQQFFISAAKSAHCLH